MTDKRAALSARLDEIEAVARATSSRAWALDPKGLPHVIDAEPATHAGWEGLHQAVAHLSMTRGHMQTEIRNAAHIALNDPATVLRQVAGVRAAVGALALHTETACRQCGGRDGGRGCPDIRCNVSECLLCGHRWPCEASSALAALSDAYCVTES